MSILHQPAEAAAGERLTPDQIAQVAVAAAVLAPSVHNTQPWRFIEGRREIIVHADAARRLDVADPVGREMLISCGAALFNIRVALRHLGYVPEVGILPAPSRPNLVARVGWGEHIPALEYEEQLYAEIERRHTHRDGFLATALPAGLLTALDVEAAREGAMLRVATQEDELIALAAAVTAAEHAARLDRFRTAELWRWTRPPGSPSLDGVPVTTGPAASERCEPHFPGRFVTHDHWRGAPASTTNVQRSEGAVALLVTSVDQAVDWIRAGQALQRVLLAASAHGVAAALHSQPMELPELREFIRVRLSCRAHPQMLLRFGATDKVSASVRRPVEDVLL
jgi:nitroreductase